MLGVGVFLLVHQRRRREQLRLILRNGEMAQVKVLSNVEDRVARGRYQRVPRWNVRFDVTPPVVIKTLDVRGSLLTAGAMTTVIRWSGATETLVPLELVDRDLP